MPRTGHAAASAGRLLVVAFLCALLVPLASAQPAPPGGPDVDVLSVSPALPAKERVTVFLSVVNDGPGDITDVEVDARPTLGSSIAVLGESLTDLGNVSDGDSGVLALRVATGDREGAAGILLSIAFLDAQGIPRAIAREVTLQIGAERSAPLRVRYVPQTLAAGAEGNLTLVAENPSDRTLRDVTIELDLSPAAGPATAGLTGAAQGLSLLRTQADLTPGARGDRLARGLSLGPGASFVMEAPVRAGLRAEDLVPFGVTATYKIDGFERSQRFDFGARVEGPVRFRVLGLREEAVEGARELSGTLVNMGPGTAWSPRLSLAPGSGFDAGDGLLVEDLKPNEPASFRLPVEEAAGAAPNGTVGLALEWNDDQGRVLRATIPATARLLPEESAEPTLLQRLAGRAGWIAALAVGAAALGAAALHARRKRAG